MVRGPRPAGGSPRTRPSAEVILPRYAMGALFFPRVHWAPLHFCTSELLE